LAWLTPTPVPSHSPVLEHDSVSTNIPFRGVGVSLPVGNYATDWTSNKAPVLTTQLPRSTLADQ
jgi:hypothetical protein